MTLKSSYMLDNYQSMNVNILIIDSNFLSTELRTLRSDRQVFKLKWQE